MIIPAGILLIAVSGIVAYLGRRRRFGFWGYFFASMLLTPLLGALIVIASGGENKEDTK